MIRRRRFCPSCVTRFTTFEIVFADDEAVDVFKRAYHGALRLRGELDDVPTKPRRLIEMLIRVLSRATAAS